MGNLGLFYTQDNRANASHSQFTNDLTNIPKYQRLVLMGVDVKYKNKNRVDSQMEYKV